MRNFNAPPEPGPEPIDDELVQPPHPSEVDRIGFRIEQGPNAPDKLPETITPRDLADPQSTSTISRGPRAALIAVGSLAVFPAPAKQASENTDSSTQTTVVVID